MLAGSLILGSQINRFGLVNCLVKLVNTRCKWNSVEMATFEEIVCKDSELADNSVKVFNIKDGKVLVTRDNGHLYAVGTKCTHYGAPMEKGVVHNGTIRCPWHGACFSLKTGDIEDFPGIDSLPAYQVFVTKDGSICVKGKSSDLTANVRKKALCKKVDGDTTFVVVGGGAAGFECVATLRENGFNGKLVLITEENVPPYDRTKLSKALSTKVDQFLLRPIEFYSELEANVDLLLNSRLTQIDFKKQTITTGCQRIPYSKLFLATGVKPRVFVAPGSQLNNILYIRSHQDANKVAAQADQKNVVILGSSFIGMEVAAFLKGKATSITVIGKGEMPFGPVLGNLIGAEVKKLFESKEIKFRMNNNIRSFEGNGTNDLVSVTLSDGEVIPADLCVIGIGTQVEIGYLDGTGLELTACGNVLTNDKMETNIANVYAGGDLAAFPLKLSKKTVSIGHWQIAQTHGKVAALNMLGGNAVVGNTVPFFWSMVFGKGLRYSGYAGDPNDVYIVGDLTELKFVAYYFSNGFVCAVATMANDPIASMFATLTKGGLKITKAEITENSTKWMKHIKST